MLHSRSLDVYRCAVAFLPKAYTIATQLDAEMANQLRRAALSINLNIAEGTGRFDRDQRKFLVTARGSAGQTHPERDAGDQLLVRIVSMLTKMIG